jgi:hypothetical protein
MHLHFMEKVSSITKIREYGPIKCTMRRDSLASKMTDYGTNRFQFPPVLLFATTSRLVLRPHSNGIGQLQILSPGVMRPKREAECVELYISNLLYGFMAQCFNHRHLVFILLLATKYSPLLNLFHFIWTKKKKKKKKKNFELRFWRLPFSILSNVQTSIIFYGDATVLTCRWIPVASLA